MGSVMLDNALSAEIGYKELPNQSVSALDIPVVAFSVGEVELGGLDTSQLVGHLAAWSYFRSIDTPENEAFIAVWRAHVGEPDAVTFDPIESAYNRIRMWAQAVEKAGSADTDAVRAAMIGQSVVSPGGNVMTMNENHHVTKPLLIGEIDDGGQFEIVFRTDPIAPDPWSSYLTRNG